MESLTIGQLASQAGVGVETVRFYEREGLLPEPPRSRAGYRVYAPTTVRRLRFIRQAKELGFSLREIGELLDLRADLAGGTHAMRTSAERKLGAIDERIRHLRRMRAALARLADARDLASSECPILDQLDAE